MSSYNTKQSGQEPNLYEILLMFSREWKLILKVFVGLMVAAILGYGISHFSSSPKRVSLIALGGYVGSPSLSRRLANVDELIELPPAQKSTGLDHVEGFISFLNTDYVERQISEKFGSSPVAVAPMSQDVLASIKAKKRDKLPPYRPVNTIKLVANSNSGSASRQVQKVLSFIRRLERSKREAFIQRVKRQIEYNERVMQGVDVAKHYKITAVQDTVNSASILTTGLSMEKMKLLKQTHALESSVDSVSEARLYLKYTDSLGGGGMADFLNYLILTTMVSALIALAVAFLATVIRQQAKDFHQG